MNIDPKQIDQGMIDAPTQTVAMVAVQAIAELSDLLYKASGHDEDSERMVMGLCAWLTSVLAGKDPAPANALLDAAKTIEQSVSDELSRAQHYLTEMVERTKAAESKALINELYAGWYLRLRDRKSGAIGVGIVQFGDPDPENCGDVDVEYYEEVTGEELDVAMEDLDTPSAAMPPPFQ